MSNKFGSKVQHCTIDHESVFKMFESSDLLLKSVLWIVLIFMA